MTRFIRLNLKPMDGFKILSRFLRKYIPTNNREATSPQVIQGTPGGLYTRLIPDVL